VSHFDQTCWTAFVRGRVEEPERGAMEDHVSSGCLFCLARLCDAERRLSRAEARRASTLEDVDGRSSGTRGHGHHPDRRTRPRPRADAFPPARPRRLAPTGT
jgi:hypothetical protein